MHASPAVSIVLPVFNDEAWVSEALDSCLRQTLDAIEVICVDDGSTDRTVDLIEQVQRRDSRVKLLRQGENRTAFQARRVGILAAQSEYVLFLDGDDELAPTAAETALAQARLSGADVVGFGVSVKAPEGHSVGGYQKRLRPPQEDIEGDAILRTFFPVSKPAQGQLWRYLFRTELLRQAYALLPEDLKLVRVNDLPITFLCMALAKRYSYVPEQLYRYFFRRGGSGHNVVDLAGFEFYANGIDAVESLRPAVRTLARRTSEPWPILDAYQSTRLSIISGVLHYLLQNTDDDLRDLCLNHLRNKVRECDVVLAAAEYMPSALPVLIKHGNKVPLGNRPVKNVLLTTKMITTGGVSLVVLAQARYLAQAGFRVFIATQRRGSQLDNLPDGVELIEVTGRKLSTRLSNWAEICESRSIDVVIDHYVQYNRNWPFYALMARTLGVPTIGWVHSFSLRPLYNLRNMVSFIQENSRALGALVALSPLDVSFWKLLGVKDTWYLPNPPSPMLLEASTSTVSKSSPEGRRLELIWWGRLEQHTKQTRELVAIAAQLKKMAVAFRLRIIGPDSADLTAKQLSDELKARRVEDHVEIVGPLHGRDLLEAIDSSDVFVSTSIIEGYQLTLAEAQARGLPVAMYEMPWLALVQNNEGLVTAPQGEARTLALKIREIAEDTQRFYRLSKASLEAAERAQAHDFASLYEQLLQGTLPAPPEPNLDDAGKLMALMVFFTERHSGIREELVEAEKSTRLVRLEARKVRAKLSANEKKLLDAKRQLKRLKSGGKPVQRASASRDKRALSTSSGSSLNAIRTTEGLSNKEESLLIRAVSPALRRIYRVAPGLRPYARKTRRFLGL